MPDGDIAPQTSQFHHLPAEMKALRQWCITPGTSTDKAPRNTNGGFAKVNDPATWSDFDTACRIAHERRWLIGFVLTAGDPFACVDLDVKPETTPEVFAHYTAIINSFDSYTEGSRSGLGAHILVLGNIGPGCKRDGIEVYSQERFIICTGNVWRNRPLASRQDMLTNMVSQMRPVSPKIDLWGDPSPDWSAANKALEDDGELGRLFKGDWEGRNYSSQSEPDLALCKLLLPHCDSPRECWAERVNDFETIGF